MEEIAIDDPTFDALLERVVRALLALDGAARPPKRRRRRMVARRDAAAA